MGTKQKLQAKYLYCAQSNQSPTNMRQLLTSYRRLCNSDKANKNPDRRKNLIAQKQHHPQQTKIYSSWCTLIFSTQQGQTKSKLFNFSLNQKKKKNLFLLFQTPKQESSIRKQNHPGTPKNRENSVELLEEENNGSNDEIKKSDMRVNIRNNTQNQSQRKTIWNKNHTVL